MSKRWISMILAVIMLLSLSIPAFAAGGQEAPPPAEAVEEVSLVEEAPPAADEIAPAEDMVTEDDIAEETIVEEAPAEEVPVEAAIDEPMTVAAGGVTFILDGAVDAVDDYFYDGPDGRHYETRTNGTSYQPHPFDYGDNTPIYVENTTTLRTQVTVAAGATVRVWLKDATHDVTVDNGTIIENYINTFIGSQRRVDIQCPSSGTVTVHINGTDEVLPELVPFTFYNEDSGWVVGGGMVDSGKEVNSRYAFGHVFDYNVVYTDSAFEEWTAPGYEIQVLKGGYISEKRAPTGAAAASVPAGTTCYVLHVDLEADEFVIAAVKQGESFQAPSTDTPQGNTPPEADTTPQTGSTFTDVASGVWYEDTVMSAYEKGIVKGVTENTFSPNGTTTRGQTVTMLYRAMGSPGGSNVFSDTSGEVGSAAGWASANGVTNGVSTTAFAPNSSITREQLVTMLYRMAGSPAVSSTDDIYMYTDGSLVQSYARNAVAWALSNGLLNGYGDGSLKPAGVATRAEVCTLIMRYLGAA